MLKEFKQFIMRGNLIDLAVAFVMGVSFTKVVSAFIDGMVMPLIGMLTGGIDFNDKKIVLKGPVAEVRNASGDIISPAAGEVAIKYGTFITVVVEFLIIAFVVFLLVKAVNRMRNKIPPPEPTKDQQLLTEIRDLLKK